MVTAAISLDVGALASAACIPSLTHPLTEQQANKYVSALLNLTVLPVKAGVITPPRDVARRHECVGNEWRLLQHWIRPRAG